MDVADVDVADRRRAVLVVREVRPLVERVDGQTDELVADVPDLDGIDGDLLQRAASPAVRLDEDRAVHVAAPAVDEPQVLHAAGDLAADAEQRVRVHDLAVAHEDVLGRRREPPGVAVAPRLDDDAVVALVEPAVLNDDVAAHLYVDAVVVAAVRVDVKVAHRRVLAQVEVKRPERRIAHLEAVPRHALAAVELHELWTGVGILHLVYLAPLHRIVRRAPGVELQTGGLDAVLLRNPRIPGRVLPLAFVPAQRARAGDRDVRAGVGVDERRVVHALHPLPRGMHGRQIVLWILREHDLGPFGEVKLAVRAEMYRAGEPFPCRHDDAAAAGFLARGHRLGERIRAEGPVGLRPKICDREVPVLEQLRDGKSASPHIVEEELRERRRARLDRMRHVLRGLAVLSAHDLRRDHEELVRGLAPEPFHEVARQRVHVHEVAILFLGKLVHRVAVASQAHAVAPVRLVDEPLPLLVERGAADRREEDRRRALIANVLHPAAHDFAEEPLRVGPALLAVELGGALLVVVPELDRDKIARPHFSDQFRPHSGLHEAFRRSAAAGIVRDAAVRLHRLLELGTPAVVGRVDAPAPAVAVVVERRVAGEVKRRRRRGERAQGEKERKGNRLFHGCELLSG